MATRLHVSSSKWRTWRATLSAVLWATLALGFAQAQDVNTYTLAAPVTGTTFTPLTGGTAIPGLLADSYITPTAIPLGFTFIFDGTPYTEVKASSNGFVSFNPAATNGFTTLAGASAANRPLIAPLGDDLDGRPTGATASASYLTTGTAPNRVFTFEWLNWEWRYNATGPVISFQVKLYEGTNRVDFVYRQESAATNATATSGASIGLAGLGTGAGSYLSLSDASATPTASSTTENTNINVKPATGQVYTFLPGPTPACPAPRNLTVGTLTTTTAPVTWTSISTGTTYTIEYGPTGFVPGSAAGTRVSNLTGTSYTITGLTPATPYQVYVTQNCGATNGNSTQTGPVAFTTLALAPANDDCVTAQALPALTITGGCTNVTGTNVGATSTPNIPAPGCANYVGSDVWYSFVVPANGAITVQTDSVGGSAITDTGMAIYSGTCGNLTLISCDDDSSPTGNFSLVTASGRTAGETIYVRVWEYGGDVFGRFKVCASFNPPAANDECATAVLLTSGATCVTTNGTVLGATQSLAAGTCGTITPPTTAADVWYRFVATSSNQIIEVNSSFTAAMEVRSGTCATSTSVACGTGSRLAVPGLTVNTTYFLRIYSTSNTAPTSPTFTVCVSTAPNTPANDNCTTAQALPTLVAGAGCNSVTGTNVGATDTPNVPAPGCANYAGGDVWYSFVVPATGGIITVDTDSISGSPVTDTGLALYSGTCGNLTFISCDDDSSPTGLFSRLRLSGRTAGEIIYVRVWEYGNDAYGRFKVCASFDLAPSNDEPTGAVTLNFAPDCVTPVSGSNTVGSTTTPLGYTNPGGCGSNSTPNDVWYTFTTLASGRGSAEATLTVSGQGAGAIRLFTAPSAAGPFTAVTNGCSAATSATAAINARSFTITTLIPSTTYYVQVANYSSFDGGSPFTICLTAPSNCPVPAGPTATVLTSTTATLTWTVNSPTPSGTFTLEYGPQGFSLPNGTRITGITGPTTTLTGLTPDTQYCFYVRQECGTASGNSAFSGPVCFRTALAPSPNDEPCNATQLTVGAAAITANNIGATPSAANGYQNPGCSTASAPRDVWFLYTAPTGSHQITVTGNPAGQVRVFSAAACAGPFTQVACQASNGSNLSAGTLTVPALTPGTVYYVSVSGYGSSDFPGNFTIQVQSAVLSNGRDLAKGEVSVYPNPSHDGTLTLSLRGVEGVSATQVEFFNALGQRVFTQAVTIRNGAVEQALPVQNLAKGIYTLRAQVGQTTITRKVVLD